ncbi:hypothetical protein [Aureispira sp. CCB-QB1]|uniref:hypothetical protein n=1 Tax=Aureispira sp. CCB-QB1 TaxID=1313421 RepID=UPI000697DE36|nr:hypothetical protein [Aureispira sp. CCB-QB1]
MQKLILLLLIAPLGLFAQSETEATRAHQQAENQLMRRYPQAKKVNLKALTQQQKEAHKQCSTCGKNKIASSSSFETQQRSMKELIANQERLVAIIKNLHESESTDVALIGKYQKALTLNLEKIKALEFHLENAKKKQKQIALKKAAQ